MFNLVRNLLYNSQKSNELPEEEPNLYQRDIIEGLDIGVRRYCGSSGSGILVTPAEKLVGDSNLNNYFAILPGNSSNYKLDVKSDLNAVRPCITNEVTDFPEGFEHYEDSLPFTAFYELEDGEDVLEVQHMDLIGEISHIETDEEGKTWYRGPKFPVYAVYDHEFDLQEFDERNLEAMESTELSPDSIIVHDSDDEEVIGRYEADRQDERIEVPALEVQFSQSNGFNE